MMILKKNKKNAKGIIIYLKNVKTVETFPRGVT